ncbi:MAG: hypothetical protein NXI32_09480 [bacterium]|nr:hypothetical protein [bacterium]
MNVPWEQARGHLERLDKPCLGTSSDWNEWYEQAWRHLCAAGLTKVEKPIDLTFVNLRIAALCWLALDFCASIEGSEWASVPNWSEWITELEIDPAVAALLLQSLGHAKHLLSDASLTDSELLISDEDAIWIIEVDHFSKRLWPQVVMNAVSHERESVIDALFVGFDGLIPLFESMFACTGECNVSLTSPERMRGYQWLEECSQVIITGVPEVNFPDSDGEGRDDRL